MLENSKELSKPCTIENSSCRLNDEMEGLLVLCTELRPIYAISNRAIMDLDNLI